MNRILDLLRGQLGRPADLTDRHLLERFLAERDEAAFAELVCRHGRVVWGVCRRLANQHDAEDAFQATFLVLVRRANRISADVPLGAWLHRVAVMTARNVIRSNRRRAAITGPMENDVAARAADSPTAWLDLDAALLALPERYRVPVVLCHLQGLTRREAAERLGCAEGTLSARLHRALTRLRARLGSRDMAALAVAGAAATPSGLAAATARKATIYTTSTLAAAGVSPTVAGLTDGVLRMFWMKKMAAGLVLVGLVAAGLFAGLAGRSGDIARATDPTPTVPLVGEPQAPPEDPDAARKRLQQRRGELEKQKAELERRTADLNAQLEKFDAAFIDQMAAAELGTDLALVVTEGGKGVGWGKPSYTVREVVGGKLGEMSCYDLGILTTYLTRAFNDPKGPKKVRIHADQNFSHDQIHKVLAACARAGFKTALFILPEAPLITTLDPKTRKPEKAEYGQKEKTIDLAGYADPKKP